jgi:hypothetical protein
MPPKSKKKKLPSLPKKYKYVLTIGDEGGILILFNGGVLERRLFISSPSSQDLSKALGEHADAPIYVLVDVLDQAFVQHTLPPVSPLAIGNLVKKRLEKDFNKDDIKAARRLFREKTGRKDWYYLFISLNYAPPISDWIEAVVNLPNPFAGIYLLPLETEPYLKKLESVNTARKASKPPRWHIMVSHNRVGGFRQIVYRDHRVIFTRIAQPIGGLAPDVIAGNIEQETLNTVEYIRRLGFENNDDLEIYVICSQEVKGAIDASKLQGRATYILTPLEVAEKLKLLAAAEKTDRFGDVVMASFFINHHRPVLRLSTPYSNRLQHFKVAELGLKIAGAVLVPLLLILSTLEIFDIVEAKGKLDETLTKKLASEKELEDIQQIQQTLPAFSDVAVDIVSVNQALTKETYRPLTFLTDFAILKGANVQVKKFELTVTQNLTAPNKMQVTYFAFINNPSGGIDKLLEDIEKFTDTVRSKFRNYEVTFSGLPGERSGTFSVDMGEKKSKQDDENKSPFEITIKGPIGEITPKTP